MNLELLKDYVNRVMDARFFSDYLRARVLNPKGYEESKSDSVRLKKAPEYIIKACQILEVSIELLETVLIEKDNIIKGVSTVETYRNMLDKFSEYLDLDILFNFITENYEYFHVGIMTTSIPDLATANKPKTSKEFFKDEAGEAVISLLKKVTHTAASSIIGAYTGTYWAISEELCNWIEKCEKMISYWGYGIIDECDYGFNTDMLIDENLCIGAAKLLLTAKMIPILED